MVPEVGLEPTQISPRDFESRASTDFATPAWGVSTYFGTRYRAKDRLTFLISSCLVPLMYLFLLAS